MLTLLHSCDNHYEVDDTFRTVKAEDTLLTKVIHPDLSRTSAATPKLFRLGKCYDIVSIKQLYPLLLRLENDPNTLVIRYQYLKNKEGDEVYRRGSEVVMPKSKIIALDIDGLDLPDGMLGTDIEAQGRYIVDILHKLDSEVFPKDLGFIAQGSSGAGLSKKIKLHMWIANKSPINQLQIKNFFSRLNIEYLKSGGTTKNFIDLALYSTVQPHYTAKPIFVNPELDPFKGGSRTSLVKGSVGFLPANYPEFVAPLRVTQEETHGFIEQIVGTSVIPPRLEAALQVLRSWRPEVAGARNAVIAIFHNALQEQVNLKVVEDEVRRLLKYLRPGQEEDYISQGKRAAMAHIKACSLRTLPDNVKGLTVSKIDAGNQPKFIHLDRPLPPEGLIFLKATLGTGKTHTISQLLQSGAIKGKFLSLTDTSALVESNARRFGAGDFRNRDDLQDFISGNSNRLSGTLHSLHKIRGLEFDFVFIDEADSVMNNLLFAPIISELNRNQIIEVLHDILRKTKVVVLSDGDLSEQTLRAYVSLAGKARPLYKIVHTRKNLQGVKAYQHPTEGSVWGALEMKLRQGKTCLLVSDSSPDSLNSYYITFNRVFKNSKNIKVVHANSKMDADVKDIINHTTAALSRQKIDALFCSPSVTNGVDFNYFDVVFVITKTDSHTPNMRFQALMRERQPKEIHYYTIRIPGFSTGFSSQIDTGWLASTRQEFSARREQEYKTYKATFAFYLISAGATIIALDNPIPNPRAEEDKEVNLMERTEAILLATEFSLIERHNDALEMQKLIKSLYNIEELTYDKIYMFLKFRVHKALELIHTIADPFWPVLITKDAIALHAAIEKSGNTFYLLTGKSLRTNPAVKILKECAIHEGTNILELIELYKRYCLFYMLKPSEMIVPATEIAEL